MACRFDELVIDCAEPEKLAEFWMSVLGWQPTGQYEGAVEIAGGPGPSLTFVPVPEPKAGKNRLHVDLRPDGCSQADELQRLLALGARQVDVGQGQKTWIVLADPEGNEFCLLSARNEA